MWRALPRLKVYLYPVPGTVRDGVSLTILVIVFTINQVLPCSPRFPRAVPTKLGNPGGHLMSPSSCHDHRVTDTHVLVIPTRKAHGTFFKNLHGRVCSRSADMGFESIHLVNGVDASVGDIILVATGNIPEEEAPSRMAGIYCPSVDVPHDASPVSVPLDDHSDPICIEVRSFRTVDAVVRVGKTRVGSLTALREI